MKDVILRAAWIVVSLGLVFSSHTALAGTLTNVFVTPSSNVVQQVNDHVVFFKLGTSATIKTIEVGYPAGFGLTTNLIDATRATSSGSQSLLSGTLTLSGQSLTYTLSGTNGTNLSAGDTIKIQVGGIANATSLNSVVAITTKNSSGGTVDTGSTTLTLAQVNSGMIQNSAVTGTQLGLNSVDSTKIVDLSVVTGDLADGAVASSKLAAGSVDQAKIADGAVTGAKLAPDSVGVSKLAANSVDSSKIVDGSVATADLADGAVTGTKLATGSVDLSKMVPNAIDSATIINGAVTADDLAFNSVSSSTVLDGSLTRADHQPIAHHLVVATSGGDYTTISAALAAINPSTTDPYVIDVMAGTYVENVTMKGNVHLRGAGREVTTVQAANTGADVIRNDFANVTISGLTVKGGLSGIKSTSTVGLMITRTRITANSQDGIQIGKSGGMESYQAGGVISENSVTVNAGVGISVGNAAPEILNNQIENNAKGISVCGCFVFPASPNIQGNHISFNTSFGIDLFNSYSAVKANDLWGNQVGLKAGDLGQPFVSGNRISASYAEGVIISGGVRLSHNILSDNSGADINVVSGGGGNISFNVYDDIAGTGAAVGLYNVNTAGGPAPAP